MNNLPLNISMLYQVWPYRASWVSHLSQFSFTGIGYCDILDIETVLSLPHGSHNIRYPVHLTHAIMSQ